MDARRQLPLAVAAHALGMTYHRLRALVLRGDLKGGQDAQGRWYAEAAGVAQYKRRQAGPKSLSPRSKPPQGSPAPSAAGAP
jgi:hypothetical protein